jgi:putative FmdB family regulatory protein
MPVYSYSCVVCGGFDLVRPMAESEAPVTCPDCGGSGRRVFGAPALRSLSTGLRNALDAQHRSADAPDVVGSLPPRTGRTQRRTTDPRHARLPRP